MKVRRRFIGWYKWFGILFIASNIVVVTAFSQSVNRIVQSRASRLAAAPISNKTPSEHRGVISKLKKKFNIFIICGDKCGASNNSTTPSTLKGGGVNGKVSSPSKTLAAAPASETPRPSDECFLSRLKKKFNIFIIRGDKYGASNNSTIPTAQEAALAVGVKPPIEASSWTWKRAWKLHKLMLPVLHMFDKLKPPESSLSLQCLWLKALAGNDPDSPVYDKSLAHDLLPRGTRVIVGKRWRRLYPRLHHANIEIRTAFLDQSVTKIVEKVRQEDASTRIRLVSLGGGYDVRSIKFRERWLVDEAVELDLPHVIEAKTKLLQSKRFTERRPWLTPSVFPEFHSVDLNDIGKVRWILTRLLVLGSSDVEPWHSIFLFEGVMIYLDEGVPSALLQVTSGVLNDLGLDGSLCFADRLENVPGGDRELGRMELARGGWELVEWQPKPGLARHMGYARLLKSSSVAE